MKVLAIGLIWGVVWAALAMIAGTAIQLIDPADISAGDEPLALAPAIAAAGFVCGAVFSLAIREKRDFLRVILFGAAVGAALPLILGKGLPEILLTAPAGAIAAFASAAAMRHRPLLTTNH